MDNMKQCKLMLLSALTTAGSMVFGSTYNASTGYVTLLAANSGNSGESTFVTNIVKATAYGWSDIRDPHSNTNYYCGFQLCTPNVYDAAYSWNGGRLVIGADFRFLASGQTITINDLQLEGNMRFMMIFNAWNEVLRGNITVLATKSAPAKVLCGRLTASWTFEASLKGDEQSCICAELHPDYKTLSSQYVELDDAVEYGGTFEVRDGLRLKLFSDMAGTVALADGSVLETSSGETVIGAMALSDESAIDLSAGGMISVTNGFSANGTTTILVPNVAGARPLISIPAGKGELSAENFDLAGPSLIPHWQRRLWVETEGGVHTLYGELLTFTVYDETTGFVVHSASTPNLNLFDEADVWSDGRIPHSDTNYCSSRTILLTTNSVFRGRSLTELTEGVIVLSGEGVRVTIDDLRVNSGKARDVGFFSTMGTSSGRSYLSGTMTVLSRVTDTWPFAFFGSNKDGQTWTSYQTICGDENSALVARGHFGSAAGAVNNYVELLGDLTKFCGTLIVQVNETLRMGGSAFPGTIRLDTAYSGLETMAASDATIEVGALKTLAACSIAVAATNRLHFSTVDITGALEKTGAGTMGVASTTLGSDATLRISAGGLKPLSANAFGGVALTFADGAGLVMDAAPEDAALASGGVDLTGSSLVAEGTLSVVFESTAGDPAVAPLPIATVTQTQAATFAATKPKLVCGSEVRRGRIITEASGGNVLVAADFRPMGLMMLVK